MKSDINEKENDKMNFTQIEFTLTAVTATVLGKFCYERFTVEYGPHIRILIFTS